MAATVSWVTNRFLSVTLPLFALPLLLAWSAATFLLRIAQRSLRWLRFLTVPPSWPRSQSVVITGAASGIGEVGGISGGGCRWVGRQWPVGWGHGSMLIGWILAGLVRMVYGASKVSMALHSGWLAGYLAGWLPLTVPSLLPLGPWIIVPP